MTVPTTGTHIHSSHGPSDQHQGQDSAVRGTPEGQSPAGGPVLVETGWLIESDPETVLVFEVGEAA